MRAKNSLPLFLKYLLCMAVLAGCGFLKKGDPGDAADDFFKLLGKGKIADAYESTAELFRMQITDKSFEATIRDLGMDDYASGVWSNKTVGDREATLDGEIANANGRKMRVVVTMVRDSGRWKLYSLLTPVTYGSSTMTNRFSGVGNGSAYGSAFMRPMPNDLEIKRLIGETMEKFNEGLHKQDFSALYNSISTVWRDQATQGQMELAFKHFLYDNLDINGISTTEPFLDEPPRMNTDGVLMLKGHYPTKPKVILFELKYVFELPKWKLLGITVTMQ